MDIVSWVLLAVAVVLIIGLVSTLFDCCNENDKLYKENLKLKREVDELDSLLEEIKTEIKRHLKCG